MQKSNVVLFFKIESEQSDERRRKDVELLSKALAKLWNRSQGGLCWAFREHPDLSSLRQAVTWMQLPRSD